VEASLEVVWEEEPYSDPKRLGMRRSNMGCGLVNRTEPQIQEGEPRGVARLVHGVKVGV